MQYEFDEKTFKVITDSGEVIFFKLGPDSLVPFEDENGVLQWPVQNVTLQTQRNLLSQALLDPAMQQQFAELLATDPSTAFNTMLSLI